ncbi:MAG TPA: Ldh family oxidoreductase [Opitutales bacterium]|nr:Ldh family oxidoreductase [Opitutales bacterium]
MEPRYEHSELVKFARALLCKVRLGPTMASDVAEILVAGDLYGKTTHGLNLLPAYLREIEAGKMTRTGAPKILKQSPATLLVDAHYLPGPFVLRRAIAWATPRAKKHGVAMVSIRRCHHIASLIAYLRPVTSQNLVILLMCSDPANRTVAAAGGVQAVCSPNPIGMGIPTTGQPILIDTTTASTANAVATRLRNEGKTFSSPILQTAAGQPTNDPRVLVANPPGTILPLGGPGLAHKGFALAIMVEALTHALAGNGRADKPSRWGASIYMQIVDPKFFGGRTAWARETEFFATICRKSKTKPGISKVRMPGDDAQAQHKEQLKHGIKLHPGILLALQPWANKYSLQIPSASQS